MRVPGPRGTEGRTWSVIDRWPTHPLLIKVTTITLSDQCPITLDEPDSTSLIPPVLMFSQTFAENIKKELATFPEEKRGKVSLIIASILSDDSPSPPIETVTLLTTRWFFSSLPIPSLSTSWTGETLILQRLNDLKYLHLLSLSIQCIVHISLGWCHCQLGDE